MRIHGFGQEHDREDTNGQNTNEVSVTPADFSWSIGKMLHERKPPFNRAEWHDPNVLIPEEWDALFELAAWCNSLVVLTNQITTRRGERQGLIIASALIDHFNEIFSDKRLMSDFAAMLLAEPIDSDHEVFSLPDSEGLNAHVHAFGRAKIAIDRVQLPESQRLTAWSKLGRCLVVNTHYATLRFGVVTEELKILDVSDTPDQETLAKKLATAAQIKNFETIGQLQERLTEIENILLRKILSDDSEATLGSEQEFVLGVEAEAIRNVLATEIGKHAGVAPHIVREANQKSKELRELQMIMQWAVAQNPADSEADRIVEQALEDYRQGRRDWNAVSEVWSSAILLHIPQTDSKYEILLKKIKAGLPHLEETIKKQNESKAPVATAGSDGPDIAPTGKKGRGWRSWFSFLKKQPSRPTKKT